MIWAWLKNLFSPRPKEAAKRNVSWPTKEEINLLPVFEALTNRDVIVVAGAAGAERACHDLLSEKVLGFDTESKPTFVRGQESNGPHVAQFSTMKQAYVFILHNKECRAAVGKIIAADVKKVGFGLNDDLKRIRIKLGVEPKNVVDVESLFRAKGYGRGVGAKVATALIFKKRFVKSKKTGTSNWGSPRLTDRQILYAANDAYISLRVFDALQ